MRWEFEFDDNRQDFTLENESSFTVDCVMDENFRRLRITTKLAIDIENRKQKTEMKNSRQIWKSARKVNFSSASFLITILGP